MKIIIALGVFLSFILASCDNCQNKAGIKVSELLELHTSKRDINYCVILREAVNLDSASIVQLFTLEIQDGAIYDHAIVLMESTVYLGESTLIDYENSFTEQERYNIARFLRLGLEYPIDEQKKLEDVFPKVAARWM